MSTEKPIITATQQKREWPGDLTDYQKDILEAMDKMKSCDIVFSISKKRLGKGESAALKIDYNGKRFFPLK